MAKAHKAKQIEIRINGVWRELAMSRRPSPIC